MIFKNTLLKLLSEAPGDEEETDTPAEEESTEESTESTEEDSQEETEEETEEESTEDPQEEEEESELSDEDQEFDSSEGGDSSLDAEGEGGTDDTEEDDVEVKGNPYAKKIYFKRFTNLDSVIARFLTTIKDQEVHYKNDDKTEKRNKEIVDYIKKELYNCQDQIKYLVEDGIIISLEMKVIHKLYASMKTKVHTCLNLYGKIMDVKL